MKDLKLLIGENEEIFYEGKPDKKCYILESIFNPMLPFAVIWAIFDLTFISGALSGQNNGMALFMILFMSVHLMPVWIYLGGALFSIIRYRNTNYVVTDRAIYVSGGVFNRTINTKPFAELSHIDLHRGVFDQMFNVGDVIATTSQTDEKGRPVAINISSIKNYAEVFNLVKKLQTDIYSDTMFPNDLRPKENHGYKTKYKG